MNDELKNKSGKVKVMYVRSDDDSDKRTVNPRTGKGAGRPASSRADGGRRPARDDRNNRGDDRKRDDRKRDDRKRDDFVRDGGSPWRTVSRAPGEEATEKADHGGISGKSFIDPEVLRRQRAEETRVYGENACQALFQSRPECIVRAWFIQAHVSAVPNHQTGRVTSFHTRGVTAMAGTFGYCSILLSVGAGVVF